MPDLDESSGRSAPAARGPMDDRRRARALREARHATGLTQIELGKKIGRHASIVSRLENAEYEYDLGVELAVKLADALDAPHLVDLATSTSRGRTTVRLASERFEVLRGVLKDRMIDRLSIVVADEIEIVELLREVRENLQCNVTIVFPSRKRQSELEGPFSATLAEANANASWNVQNQINRVFEATSIDSVEHIGAELTLYESDQVRGSFVIAGTSDGVFCVLWSSQGNFVRDVPATASSKPHLLADMELNLTAVLEGCKPLTHLKAVAILDEPSEPAATYRHELTNFFTLGKDSEEKILEKRGNASDEQPPTAGFAVSLVLVHGVVARVDRGLGRRLLLPWDRKSGRYELFATHVSNSAFGEDEPGSEHVRPHESATAAVERVADLNLSSGNTPGLIGPEVFQRAASRWVLDEYDVAVPSEAFREIQLPPELRIVEKGEKRLPVLPRLFELDLSPQRSAGVSTDSAPRGAAGVDFRDELRRAFHHDKHVLKVGLGDLRSQNIPFNNFIDKARTFGSGWLLEAAKSLGITEQ